MNKKFKIGDYVLTEDGSVVRIISDTEDGYIAVELSGKTLPREYSEDSLHVDEFKVGDWVQIQRCIGIPISSNIKMYSLIGQYGLVKSVDKSRGVLVDIEGETNRWRWNPHDLKKIDTQLKIGDLVTLVSNDAGTQYKISGYSPSGYKISHLDGDEKPEIFKIDSLKKIPKFKIGERVIPANNKSFYYMNSDHAYVEKIMDGKYFLSYPDGVRDHIPHTEDELKITGQKFKIGDRVLKQDGSEFYIGPRFIGEYVKAGYLLTKQNNEMGGITWHDHELKKYENLKRLYFNKFKYIESQGVEEYERNHVFIDDFHGVLFDPSSDCALLHGYSPRCIKIEWCDEK